MTETNAAMQMMAETLDGFLNGDRAPKRIGFALLVFPFDAPPGARTNYISNADRATMVVALKEIVARFEGRHQEGGRA
jgi:hypothetical protein